MIAYNTKLLDHIAIVKKTKQWYANKLISTDQMGVILKTYPINYFQPNVFIKIGLFIFTLIIISAALSFSSLFTFSLFLHSDSMTGYAITVSLLFGGLCIFVLERLIKDRNWYNNGIDNALLYSALSFIISVMAFSLSNNINESDRFLIMALLMLPVLFFAMIRYIDRIVSVLLIACVYMISFLLILKLGSIAKLIMPFAFMALSLAVYFYIKKQLEKGSIPHLNKCLKVISTITLLVFYFSGNYFVIRECSTEYFGLNLQEGTDIPLAFIFYAFTALVPLFYLYRGLQRKDKTLLWTSLLLIGVAAMTFKYYFSLGHPEITLTLAGIVMILVSYFSVRYLKVDKKGITFKLDPDEETFLKSNAEALLIAQSFGGAAQSGNQGGIDMGGGTFGGAGSGGNY